MKIDKIIKLIFVTMMVLVSFFSEAVEYPGCIKLKVKNYDKAGKPYITPLGRLERYSCPTASGLLDDRPEYVVLDGKELFKEINLAGGDVNVTRTVFIYDGGKIRGSLIGGCAGTQYLLDLRGKRPRLIDFGIKNACNQMDEVIWKKDRVIINFNREAKFEYIYSTGEMKLPKDDPDRYDPVFDENSPVIDQYQRGGTRHLRYEIAPPYANEVKLDW